MTIVDVVIVEAHHHCLEHIHSVLRKRKIFQSWTMIHFDAHPDLACPTIPARGCFTPRQTMDGESNFYEMLDARPSGIAEWILPLTLAAQLRTIEWIKPKFSKQLPCGRHSIQVGVHDPTWTGSSRKPSHFLDLGYGGQLKVDWYHPYYLDDETVVVVPATDLALSQTLTLFVTELNNEHPDLALGTPKDFMATEPWILDICLDYFACWNPYLSDIDSIDTELTVSFLEVMRHSKVFGDANQRTMDPAVSRVYIEELHDFRNLLHQVLIAEDPGSAPDIETSRLFRYYDSPSLGKQLIENLDSHIRRNGETALKVVLEAIPFWNMPHSVTSKETEAIEKSILQVETSLRRFLNNNPHCRVPPPFLITIARSTSDGFAPAEVVEGIQDRVLAMLNRLFTIDLTPPGGEQYLRITKDYDEWEGSVLP